MGVAGAPQAELHREAHGLQLHVDVTLVGEGGGRHAQHVGRALGEQLLG